MKILDILICILIFLLAARCWIIIHRRRKPKRNPGSAPLDWLIANDNLIFICALTGNPAASQIVRLYDRWRKYSNSPACHLSLLRAVDEFRKARLN